MRADLRAAHQRRYAVPDIQVRLQLQLREIEGDVPPVHRGEPTRRADLRRLRRARSRRDDPNRARRQGDQEGQQGQARQEIVSAAVSIEWQRLLLFSVNKVNNTFLCLLSFTIHALVLILFAFLIGLELIQRLIDFCGHNSYRSRRKHFTSMRLGDVLILKSRKCCNQGGSSFCSLLKV